MRRGVAGALALVIAASSACVSVKAEVLVVNPSVTEPPTSAPEPSSTAPEQFDDTKFQAVSLAEFDGGEVVTIPNIGSVDEAAVHALAATPDGWVAAGSITSTPNPGWAAVWHVGADGTFGDADVLPSLGFGAPSFARDILTFGADTIAVGRTGAGRDAVATAWLLRADGTRTAVALPIEQFHGSTADIALRLDDGTIVVVGRGEGPFFSTLLLWWSSDGGSTWSSLNPNIHAFLEPNAATDGTRVAVLARGFKGADGIAGFDSAVFVHNSQGLVLQAKQAILPTPNNRYWPKDLVWDGAAFVAGFDTNDLPLLATSADGLTYTVAPMDLAGVTETGIIEGLAVVDGALEVFIDQDYLVLAFRRDAGAWVPLPIPSFASGKMEFLIGHEPIATDGHRLAYLTATWYSRALLRWDGTAWSARDVGELPIHRNTSRIDVRDIASTAGSDLAVLDYSEETSQGVMGSRPAGLLWRPAGQDAWEQLDIAGWINQPSSITVWDKQFVIADFDGLANETHIWRFDPATGEFSLIGTLPGRARTVVSADDGLYVRSTGADGPTVTTATVSMSVDGSQWSRVVLPAEPIALCSNGARAAAVWAKPEETRDELGVEALWVGEAKPLRASLTSGLFEIVPESRDIAQCARSDSLVITAHHGYDSIVAEEVPLMRVVPVYDSVVVDNGKLFPLMPPGADETWIDDIVADGTGWVAVGTTRDTEVSMDATLWRSADGYEWERGETIAGGPGNQIARTVTVRDGELLIGGVDGQQAMIWRLPA